MSKHSTNGKGKASKMRKAAKWLDRVVAAIRGNKNRNGKANRGKK